MPRNKYLLCRTINIVLSGMEWGSGLAFRRREVAVGAGTVLSSLAPPPAARSLGVAPEGCGAGLSNFSHSEEKRWRYKAAYILGQNFEFATNYQTS